MTKRECLLKNASEKIVKANRNGDYKTMRIIENCALNVFHRDELDAAVKAEAERGQLDVTCLLRSA